MGEYLTAMRAITKKLSIAEYDPKWDAEKAAKYNGYIRGLQTALDIINALFDKELEEMAKEYGEQ